MQHNDELDALDFGRKEISLPEGRAEVPTKDSPTYITLKDGTKVSLAEVDRYYNEVMGKGSQALKRVMDLNTWKCPLCSLRLSSHNNKELYELRNQHVAQHRGPRGELVNA